MNDSEKELAEAERDVAKSKKVLHAAKNKAKAVKGGKLERKQAKRVLKSIKDGVDLVEERCDNLHKHVASEGDPRG
jgi:hydroxymethylpyrimidine/phosphomethylpyrimidine kinase